MRQWEIKHFERFSMAAFTRRRVLMKKNVYISHLPAYSSYLCVIKPPALLAVSARATNTATSPFQTETQ